VRKHIANRFKEVTYEIDLRVKDYDFCKTFSLLIARVLNKRVKEPKRIKDGRWKVYYKSVAFYEWAKKFKTSFEDNLEELSKYIEYNKETVRYFLRGLFDAEGTNSRNKQLFLYDSNKTLLEYAKYLLERYFNIRVIGPRLLYRAGTIKKKKNGKIIVSKQDIYCIGISRYADIIKFLKQIGFSISRKQIGS